MSTAFDLECSLCDRALPLTPTTVEALTLSTLAFVVGRLDVEGWRVYLTSSGEPTTVCDRCRAAHPSAVLILDAATDQVRENLHQVGVA